MESNFGAFLQWTLFPFLILLPLSLSSTETSAGTSLPLPHHVPHTMAFIHKHTKLPPAHRCLHLLFTLLGRLLPVSFSAFISYLNNHLLRDTSLTSPPESVLHLSPGTLPYSPLRLFFGVLLIKKSVFIYLFIVSFRLLLVYKFHKMGTSPIFCTLKHRAHNRSQTNNRWRNEWIVQCFSEESHSFSRETVEYWISYYI